MPALLPRLSAAAVGAAVALAVLGTPGTSLAADPRDPGAAGTARAAQQGPAAVPTPTASSAGAARAAVGSAGGAAAGRSTAQAAAERAAASTGRSAAAQRPAAGTAPQAKAAQRAEAARQAKAAKQAKAAERATAAKAAKAKAAKPAAPAKPAKAAAPKSAVEQPGKSGDPGGNNGTFKVDGPVLDTSHGNEPQVDCAFRLNFFGYDAGQLATIVFTPIAPTAGASTSVSGLQLISSDPAKGGLYNGSYPVAGTWTAADLGLDPTVRQHVEVSVESFNADGSEVPGGAKHKVFWLHPRGTTASEASQAPAVETAVETAALPLAAPFGPRSITSAPAAQPATAATTVQPAAALPVMGPQAQPQAQVLGATLRAQAAQAPTQVTVRTQATLARAPHPHAQPTVLPFTGSPQLIALMIGGLIALLGGAGLVAAARTSA